MYFTSYDYDLSIDSPIREPHFAKIIFGLSNDDIQLSAKITDNGHTNFSNSLAIAQGVDVYKTFETFEWNRFALDGRNILASKSSPIYQGYCSSAISGDGNTTNTFSINPKLTITFKEIKEIKGLSLQFDTTKNDFVTKLLIKTFGEDGSIIEEIRGKVDLTEYPMFIYNKKFKSFKKMEIEFLETFPSKRRVRVFSILFGITKIIDDEILKSVNFNNDMDLAATSLPTQTMNFTILDTNSIYDVDNPNNINKYLENGQPTTLLLGYQLSNDRVEWINVSKTYTTGNITSSGTPEMAEITIDTESILSKLDIIYDESVATPKNLYDLANELVAFTGYSVILDLDPVLKQYTTNIVFPKITVREGLQLIANAGMCVIGIHRSGQIYIRREQSISNETEFNFNYENTIDYPVASKIPLLRTLTSSYNNTFKENSKELLSISINNTEIKDVVLEIETSTDHEIFCSESIKIVGDVRYYCNSIKFKAIGVGNIVVNGRPIKTNQIKQYYDSQLDGTNLSIHNPLINSREWCLQYMAYMVGNYIRRSSYEIQSRGYPKLDLMDIVEVQNNFGEMKRGVIIENSLSYDGALEGKCKIVSNERGVDLGRTR